MSTYSDFSAVQSVDNQKTADYQRAYDDAWALAYIAACSNPALHGPDVMTEVRTSAHRVAASYAELSQALRYS